MKAGSGAHLAPYSVGNVGASLEQSDIGKRLKKPCHLLSSLRMSSATPLPPYAFMVYTVIFYLIFLRICKIVQCVTNDMRIIVSLYVNLVGRPVKNTRKSESNTSAGL